MSSTSFKKNEDHSWVTTTISFVSKCWPTTVPANNKPSLTWVNCITAFWTMLYYSRQTTSMMTWPTQPHSYREPWTPWTIIEDTIFVHGHGTWQCHSLRSRSLSPGCPGPASTITGRATTITVVIAVGPWKLVEVWQSESGFSQERVPKFLWQIKGALNCDICCPPARRNK